MPVRRTKKIPFIHPSVMHPFRALVLVRKDRVESFPLRLAQAVPVTAHASNSLWIDFGKNDR